MRKSILIALLAVVFLTSGCANKDAQVQQKPSTTEDGAVKDDASYDISRLEDYMTSVEEQSSAIKSFLEYDAMTQDEMNEKSKELYDLWDEALNYLWGELKSNLSEEEFVKLQDEQRIWITEKEDALKEAGKEFEGGSIYALVVNSEGARITEERVYELYTLLKQ